MVITKPLILSYELEFDLNLKKKNYVIIKLSQIKKGNEYNLLPV